MYCTNCGRKLAEDGTPCVCGSGQCEPGAMPAAEPISEPAELAVEETAEPAAEAPAVEPGVLPAEPEDTALPVEPVAYEEPAAPVEEAAEPAAMEPQNPYVQSTDPYAQQGNPYVQPNPYAQQNPYAQPAPVYAPPAYAVQQPNEVHTAIRSIAASPIFMVATILMSAHFVLTLIRSFLPTDMMALINTILPLMQAVDPSLVYDSSVIGEMTEALYQIQAALGLLNLPAMIVPALVLVGLWLTFVSAKKKEIPSGSGLMILQIVKILALVGTILSTLLVLIIGIAVVVAVGALAAEMSSYSGYYGYSSAETSAATGITVILVIVLILLLAVMAFSIVYAVKVVTSITGARKALKTGKVEKTASMLVAVFCFISAGITVLDMFGSIALSGWMNLPLSLCSAGANVLFALCIMQYNKAVKPLIAPKYQPVQQMPVPPQYPPYNG